MFEISDDAMELILAPLDAATEGRLDLQKGTSQLGLRLNLTPAGAHLSLESPRATDRVMSFMGRTLHIVDSADFSHLARTRLTVERGLNGKTLSMEPNIPEKVA